MRRLRAFCILVPHVLPVISPLPLFSLFSPLLDARFYAEVEMTTLHVALRFGRKPSTHRLSSTLSSQDCGWQLTPIKDEPSSDNKQHIENAFLWP